ncbi:MAG: efflux RND transporter periplasmic adaptor subunit [Acidobacteria bacterium]|nr:MAG: efflux RND transporter periplasmic adaptor subunit [Acidobacteriota bacterium]
MKKIAGILVIILIVVGLVGVRMLRAREKNEAPTVGTEAPLVATATVGQGRVARSRHVLGTVIGADETELAPRITGQIVTVNVREGAAVRRGQVLVRLDDRELQDAVGKAEAALAAAREGLAAAEVAAQTQTSSTARDRTLFEAGAISKEALERSTALEAAAEARLAAAHSAVEQAQRALNQARVRLAYATLEAPFDGVVAARLADPGDLAVPGRAVLRLVAGGGIRVRAALPSGDLPFLRQGAAARLPGPEGALEATVSRVFPALGDDRLVAFEIDLTDPPADFLSGTAVGVDVELTAAEGVVVPSDALLESERGTFVFAIRDGAVATVAVTVEARSVEQAVIRGDVAPGETVAVGRPSRLMRLASGMRVRMTAQAESRP